MAYVPSDADVEQLQRAVRGLAEAIAKVKPLLPHILEAERLAQIETLFEHLRVDANLVEPEKVTQQARLLDRPTLRLVSSRDVAQPAHHDAG